MHSRVAKIIGIAVLPHPMRYLLGPKWPAPERTASSASLRIRSSASRNAFSPTLGSKVQSIDTISALKFSIRTSLGVSDKGAVQNQDFGLRAAFVQHVFQVTETCFQRHHAIFTQTVNRWVRHLREVLAEIMAKRAVFFDRTADGVSSPMDANVSLPSSAIGARICSISSML